MFYGRKKELAELEKMYSSEKFEFAVFYGRRRVGKTTLINEFCKDKKVIFFTGAETTSDERILKHFENPNKQIPCVILYPSTYTEMESIEGENEMCDDDFLSKAQKIKPYKDFYKIKVDLPRI